MPKIGDKFITVLKQAHLQWGSHRYTNSRGIVYGEGYLQIPAYIARKFFITNSNRGSGAIYKCNSTDGYLNDVTILATRCSKKGNIFAKQFQGKGDLKLLGDWFHHIGAVEGDQIEILFISPNKIFLTKL